MELDINFLIKSFIALFTVIDPIGGAPFFLSITTGYTPDEKKKIAFKASLTAFITLSIFLWSGNYLLRFFQISIASFKIAGGILLFLTAVEMLFGKIRQAKTSQEETESVIEKEDISIVPLAIPYLAGPGAITTIIILGNNSNLITKFILLLIVFLICLLTYIIFCYANKVFKFFGELGTKAIVRILGLLLATIAIEYIIHGLKEAFK
ncbi:MAG: hypothetical protein DRP29_05800 [Thermodesulfobacteriota bacterium]|nr:MAG: hypothetical protein DRP29_05800 [Thermodesulfobacteriota bacterium]